MIAKFDKFSRFEIPAMTLCNPGSKLVHFDGDIDDPLFSGYCSPTNSIGILSNTSDEELIINFNAISELNFRIYDVRTNDDSDGQMHRIFKSVQNRRLIYLEDIGYFSITNVSDGYAGNEVYKDVSAFSCEIEIQNKMLPNIENKTYRFSDEDVIGGESGILQLVVSSIPMWTISDVANSVASRHRTFEDVSVEKNCLSFMIEDLQNAYECVFLFDIENRTISVRDQNDFLEQMPIHITRNDLVKQIDITENSDDLYTSINVTGDNDLAISGVNPMGKNTIYNFDYYLSWMSDGLRDKINIWKSRMELVSRNARKAYINPDGSEFRSDWLIDENGNTISSSLYSSGDVCFIASEESEYYNRVYYVASSRLRYTEADIDPSEMIDGNTGTYPYVSLAKLYYEALEDKNESSLELDRLENLKYLYTRCRDNVVAESKGDIVSQYNDAIRSIMKNGEEGRTISITDDITALKDNINRLISGIDEDILSERGRYESIQESENYWKEAMDGVRNIVSFESIFADDDNLLQELQNYIFEGSYNDEYITQTESMTQSERFDQMKLLYDRGIEQLRKISQPTQETSIDVESFIFSDAFKHMTSNLETGKLLSVEIEDGDIANLFLTSINVNFFDKTLGFTLGNRLNKYDQRSLFENALGQISKSANTLDYVKDIIYPISDGQFDAAKRAIENSRNITMNAALSASGQQVVIDDSGYTGKIKSDNAEYLERYNGFDPHQIKITGRTIAFTDNGWETSKTVVGEFDIGNEQSVYGINGEAIVGNILYGQNLKIVGTDESGQTYDMLSAMNGRIDSNISSVNDLVSSVSSLSQTAEALSIQIENKQVDSVTTSTGYVFDKNGDRKSVV